MMSVFISIQFHSGSLITPNPLCSSTELAGLGENLRTDWQFKADSVSSSLLIELLYYLDQLGFETN
jgi:hypothetical protein